jgi:hypothetical protein
MAGKSIDLSPRVLSKGDLERTQAQEPILQEAGPDSWMAFKDPNSL